MLGYQVIFWGAWCCTWRHVPLGHLEHLENLVQVRGQLIFLLTSHSRAKVLHLRELLADKDPLWSRSWSFFLSCSWFWPLSWSW